MRVLALGLLLVLVACAPALAPTHERTNGDVTVSVLANAPVFDVTVTVLNAVSRDERCTALGTDLWCELGDIGRGEAVSVEVVGPVGLVACTAAGYLDESLRVTSYRAFACRARVGGE
jgi:hypothetical protein